MKKESTANPTPTTESTDAAPETADDHKQRGNECIRNGKYNEAILHYSFAIKLTPNDAVLYSNRSLAFLKINNLYYANEDAEKAIQCKSDWAKGYFRRAEVQAAAGQYDSSLLLYGRALQLQPNDIGILNAAKRVASLSTQETLYENRLPWVGAAIGIILGVIIVIADNVLTKTPTLKHPPLMVLMIIVISLCGYGVAKVYRYYAKLQRRGLLDPPIDLLEDFRKPVENDAETEQEPLTNRSRYTKAQARQRFKRGKT